MFNSGSGGGESGFGMVDLTDCAGGFSTSHSEPCEPPSCSGYGYNGPPLKMDSSHGEEVQLHQNQSHDFQIRTSFQKDSPGLSLPHTVLGSQNDQLKELDDLRKDNEKLKNEMLLLTSEIQAKQKEIENLREHQRIQQESLNSNMRLEIEAKNKELKDLKQENEIYKSCISKLRSDNQAKQKELKDLRKELQHSQRERHNVKERMQKLVDLTLGSSGDLSEDITNPCRESELKNMYEKLSKNQWAKLLFQLKRGQPKELRTLAEQVIKDVLRQSQADMSDIMNTMRRMSPSRHGHSINTKATQYFDLSIQNLQMAIYHEKTGLYDSDKLQGVPELLHPVVEECYKIGSLMALHNPPLLLDFNNCGKRPFPPIMTKWSCAAVEPSEKSTEPTVFIAIDLGTAFSGYCFWIAGSEQIWQPKWGEESSFSTPKIPSCILFDENEEVVNFGYDAEMTYRLSRKNELMLFDNFKMEQYGKDLHKDFMITAKNRKQMRAMKVFSESLRFMKDHALETIGKHTAGVKYSASDATWILTVPAIWSAAAKQFMREAATEAGLVANPDSERLITVLEPVAASTWCRQLLSKGVLDGDLEGSEKIGNVSGTQLMVVDCGGVTINITVHEVVEAGRLKELLCSSKTYRYETAYRSIRSFLRCTFSETVLEEFEKTFPNELWRLVCDYSGNENCLSLLRELVRKDTEAYSQKNPQEKVRLIDDSLKSLHEEIGRGIESQIKDILIGHNPNIRYIILAGGFALNPYVKSFLEEKFRGRCKVLCPHDGQMAVLKGAVIFGSVPNSMKS